MRHRILDDLTVSAPPPRQPPPLPTVKGWTDDEMREFLRLAADGCTAKDLAVAMGKELRTIQKQARRLQLTLATPRDDFWKDDMVDRLREAWSDATLSMSGVGREVGVSPNAAIRKATELRLGDRPKPAFRLKFGKKVASRDPGEEAAPRPVHKSLTSALFHETAEAIDLLDLKAGQCRWPFGSGPFRFCGCRCVEGKSYCGEHYRASIATRADEDAA